MKSLRVIYSVETYDFPGTFWSFVLTIHNASSKSATQKLIDRHFPPKSLKLDHPRSNPYAHEFSFPLVKKVSFFSTCILGALISLRTGSTITYITTFVLGALKTPNINRRYAEA
ncbi:hypothetical protein IGI04_023455, partial [Brassica rapa subsp. trilocularis]